MNSSDFLKFDRFYRYDLINFYIDLYSYKSYLEIGIDDGDNFKRIRCDNKLGVDPEKKYSNLTHHMTSDEFFIQNDEKFDIIFIDGSHLHEQVIRDIDNGFNVLNPKGTIILHDCLPLNEKSQSRERSDNHWNGDVWKAFVHYRKYKDLFMMTINADQGLGVLRAGKQKAITVDQELNFKFFWNNLDYLMNTVSVGNGLEIIKDLYKLGL